LPFFFALLAFEALHRCQKPRCLWLAIDHGGRSFRDLDPFSPGSLGYAVVTGWFPAFVPAPEQLDCPLSSSILCDRRGALSRVFLTAMKTESSRTES
jgi:hypothetical protein